MMNLDFWLSLCNIPDLIVIFVLLISFLVGWHKGLLHTLYKLGGKLAALLASLFLAKLFTPTVASVVISPAIEQYITKQYGEMLASNPLPAGLLESTIAAAVKSAAESIAYCILFFVCFVLILWAMNVLIFGAKKLLKKTPLGVLNRLGGAAISTCGAAVLLVLFLVLLRQFSPNTFGSYGVLSPERVEKTVLVQTVIDALPPST